MLRRRIAGQESNGPDVVEEGDLAVATARVTPTEPTTPAQAPPPASLARTAPQVPETLVGVGSIWEGKLVTESNVRVEGTLHGEVQTSRSLHVAAHARLDGAITAREIVLAGEIEGEVRCGVRLELLEGSSLIGDIETVTLVVHEGAFIEASRFKMAKVEAPGRRYR